MYGAGCSKECGHCVNGEQCNPVHGTCRNGCEAGYYKKKGVKEVEPATQCTLIHLSNNIDDLFAFPDYIEIR